MKIGIGTAQFGSNYGISNTNGKVDYRKVAEILERAKKEKIYTLDTASAYGDCESILGKIGVSDFSVVTKLNINNINSYDQDVKKALEKSLHSLKINSLYGYLIHNANALLGPNADNIYGDLYDLKSQGLIKKIGASFYNPDELELISERYKIDLVQIPTNIIDRRFAESGIIDNLESQNIEVHIRSIYLQGLLLLNVDNLPKYFDQWKPLFKKFKKWLVSNGTNEVEACMNYVTGLVEKGKIIIGLTSLHELEEALRLTNKDTKLNFPNFFKSSDENLINPSNWKID